MQKTILVLQIVVTNERRSYNSVVVNDKFHCITKFVTFEIVFANDPQFSEHLEFYQTPYQSSSRFAFKSHKASSPVGGRKVFGLTGLCIKDRLQAEDSSQSPEWVLTVIFVSLSETGSIAPIQQ